MINPVCPECDVTISYDISGIAYCPKCLQQFPAHKQAPWNGKKRVVAVQHAGGVLEFECPDCGNYMVVCDTTQSVFGQGEYSETGKEYLFCQKCGKEFEFDQVAYPKDEVQPVGEIG